MSDLPPTQPVTPRQAGLRKGAKPGEFDAATIRNRLRYIAQLIAPLQGLDIEGAIVEASPSLANFADDIQGVIAEAINVMEQSQADRANTLETNRAANRRDGR